MSKFIKTGKTTQGRTIPILTTQAEVLHREIATTGTSAQATISPACSLISFYAIGTDVRIKFGSNPTASSSACSYIVPAGQIIQIENDNSFTQFAHQAMVGSGTLVVTEL